MEEIKDFTHDLSWKKRFVLQKGQKIRVDYFIFSVFEEDALARFFGAHLPQAPKRFPIADRLLKKEPVDEEVTLESLLDQLFDWYEKEAPILRDSGVYDYEKHGQFVYPFVYLMWDLGLLYEFKMKKRIPRIEEEKDPFWQGLFERVQVFFGESKDFVQAYLAWHYRTPRAHSVDLASLPPVGRYVPILRRHTTPSGMVSGALPLIKADQKDNGHKTGSDEEQALKAVEDAVHLLQSDESRQEVTLPPENSFIRRQQHKKAIALGFNSISVGEGDARGVQIVRVIVE
jgi:hypothetical protein